MSSFFDEIAAKLAQLSGVATPEVSRDELNEFNVRDIQAVTVSEGGSGGGGSQPDPYAALNGFEAWTFDPGPASITGDVTIFDQPYFAKVPINRAASIASLVVLQGDHDGITPSYGKVAVYSPDGQTQLGITVDLTAIWTTIAIQELPMAAPTPVTPPFVWIGFLAVDGGPGLIGTYGQDQAFALPFNTANYGCATTGTTLRWGLLVGALTELPATFDPTTLVEDTTTSFPWVGLVAA